MTSSANSSSSSDFSLCQMVEIHLQEYFAAHKDHLPESGLYGRVMREIERILIRQTLNAVGGNQVKAASILGINRNTLRKKIQELGVEL